MSRRSILLITPNWRWDRTPLSTDTLRPPVSPPLEMGYIASGLDDVRFVDAYATDMDADALAAEVGETAPDRIVISTTPSALYWRCPPMTVDAARIAVDACRTTSSAPVVLIGPHGTFTPDWALSATGADLCFRGAPERALAPDLVAPDLLGPHLHRPGGVSSMCVEPAHSLPRCRADIFDVSLYPPHMWCVSEGERQIAKALRVGALSETSRGCPWQCVYCAKAPVRDQYGRRDLSLLREEWRDLVDRGVEYVFFIDETFNLGGARLDRLLEALGETGLRFGFQGRPELIDEAQAQALAAAGCVYAELGIDINASDLSRRAGRRQEPDKAWAGVRTCAQAVPIVRYNRLNLSTLDYRTRLGLDDGTAWDVAPDPAYPYPGAPLGDMVMRLYGRDGFDWDFALRYSWWLRLEVASQRADAGIGDDELARRQAAFLALDDDAARAVAQGAEGVQYDEQFAEANKLVAAS